MREQNYVVVRVWSVLAIYNKYVYLQLVLRFLCRFLVLISDMS